MEVKAHIIKYAFLCFEIALKQLKHLCTKKKGEKEKKRKG
jgi:hypothetical protein